MPGGADWPAKAPCGVWAALALALLAAGIGLAALLIGS